MAGLVQLIKGDLFDGPSDLVVLPCSTAGTFTSLVAQKLRLFSIPAPRSMALGEVEIHPLQDAAHVAQFAAFAASVAGFKSTPDAIQKIGAALGRATEDRTSIRVVNAPLLGAGAGGIRVGAEDFRDALSSAREDRPSEFRRRSRRSAVVASLLRLTGASLRVVHFRFPIAVHFSVPLDTRRPPSSLRLRTTGLLGLELASPSRSKSAAKLTLNDFAVGPLVLERTYSAFEGDARDGGVRAAVGYSASLPEQLSDPSDSPDSARLPGLAGGDRRPRLRVGQGRRAV